MNCQNENCRTEITVGEERAFRGQILCEDCYMDALSPARTCDPWAVRSATISRSSGDTVESAGLQQKILRLLESCGGMAVKELASRLSAHHGDIEREIAALRHMEKVRGALREGKKVIQLW